MRDSTELLEHVRWVVKNAPNGIAAKAVAEGVGKAYSALMNELNPDVDTHKLGLVTLLDIVRLTGSESPIHAIAAMHGGVFLKFSGEAPRMATQELHAKTLFCCADFMKEVMASGSVSRTVEEKGYALQLAIAELVQGNSYKGHSPE